MIDSSKKCSLCKNEFFAKGYCKKCYHRQYSSERRKLQTTDVNKKCLIEGCSRLKYAHGYCSSHYFIEKGKTNFTNRSCSLEGCNKPYHGKDFCITHYRKKYGRNEDLKTRYNYSISRARLRGIEFNLTEEEYINLIKDKNCFYCQGTLNKTGVGLDRINNSKGYISENCVACCKECNTLKGHQLSCDEMVLVISMLRTSRNKIKIWD